MSRKTKIKKVNGDVKKYNWVLDYIQRKVEVKLEPLTNSLLATFRLLFIINNYSFTERQIENLFNNQEFIDKFNLCIRDSLKDYNNTTIGFSQLFENIKFNLGLVYGWLDDYSERMCQE